MKAHLSAARRRPGPDEKHASRGFTLLEIILAMGLFALVAVGLMGALNEVSLATLESGDSAFVTRQLRSYLTEVVHDGGLQAGHLKTEPDERGIWLETEVEELALQNEDGKKLPGMLRIEVTAYQGSANSEPIDRAETWIYRPLFSGR